MLGKLFGRKAATREVVDHRVTPLDLTDTTTIVDFADRATGELAQISVCPLANGGQLLLDPLDVSAAFSDKSYSNEPSRFSALAPRNRDRHVAASVAANIPPFQDGARHKTVRRWLTKSVATTLAPFQHSLPERAESYAANLDLSAPQLLVETVARDFITATICAFVGVRFSAEELKTYTSALFKLFAPIHDADAFARTNAALDAARAAIIAQLPQGPEDDAESLINAMMVWSALLDDLDLPVADRPNLIADNVLLVLADGVENVEAAVGEVMVRWASITPAERPTIDEQFVRNVIHEATPGQTIARIASAPVTLGGQTLPAGSPVFLSLAAANARETENRDFSFGTGRHRCIGEHLAVKIIANLCAALAARGPVIRTENMRFEPVFGHRWMRDVWIEFDG